MFGDHGTNYNWFLDYDYIDPLTLDAGTNTPTITVNNQAATIGTVLAGTGGLAKAGNGTNILTGANTYTGTTTVNAGRLQLTNPAVPNINGTNNILAGAAMEINLAADWFNVSEIVTIGGNGTLVKSGPGGWKVAGTTFAMTGGLVNVQGGTMSDGSHSTFFTTNLAGLNVATGATAQINGNDWSVDALTGDGTVQLNYINTRYITVGVNNGSGVFTGVLNEGTGASGYTLSLIKAGTGTQTLAGTNTYTGTTTVRGGTLLVNGSIATGAVTVQTNGTLGGYGAIGGPVTVQNGGTVAQARASAR